MSDCIISIRIGDQVITLNANSSISPEDTEALVNSIDVNKLRILYSNLKDQASFDTTLEAVDPKLAVVGESVYDRMADEALTAKDSEGNAAPRYLSPFAAMKEAPSADKPALSAYLSSLNPNEVHPTGNFLDDMKNTYMLSPYSHTDIRTLVFNTGHSTTRSLKLYDQLLSIPGMETTRISIAYANEINGRKIDKIEGAYISPDNIVQLILPMSSKYRQEADNIDGVSKANIPKKVLNELQAKMLHELSHAVYTELLRSDSNFFDKMKKLHDSFVKHIKEHPELKLDGFVNAYKNIDEFMSDALGNQVLQEALTKVMSVGIEGNKKVYLHETIGNNPFYSFLISSLPARLQEGHTLLKDVLALAGHSIPKGELTDSFDLDAARYNTLNTKQSIFFSPTGDDPIADEAHIGRVDQTDTPWSVNAQANRLQLEYLSRVAPTDGSQSTKDAYYGASIDKPSTAQIDQLYKGDLALIPWLAYKRMHGAIGDAKGVWVRQGVAMKNGNVVMENGKMKIVDLNYDAKGRLLQDPEAGYTVEERFRHVPVMFSNTKKGTVRVAKVGLDQAKVNAPGYDGYNSINIPYEFITGIRKYNWDFFDHNLDYQKELDEANAELKSKDNEVEGPQARIDNVSFLEKRVQKLQGNSLKGEEGYVAKAARIKNELSDLYKKYAFNLTEADGEAKHYTKNITEADYKAAGFDKKYGMDNITFASPNDAMFVMQKTSKGWMSKPNPAKFLEIWQDEAGKEFAKTSQSVAEAVTQGDLVRIHSEIKEVVNGEKVTINKSSWMPVYQKLPNGVLVGTLLGKGLIVPFNQIDSYAKNVNSASYVDLVRKQSEALDTFKENMWNTTTLDNGKKKAVSNKEYVKFRPINVDGKDFDPNNEQEKDSITRFNKNIDEVRKVIQPGKTFVKMIRGFVSRDPTVGKTSYQTTELVMAHTDEGLYTFREKENGDHVFSFTKYTDNFDPKEQFSKQLLFLLEDVSEVTKQWNDYQAEKDMYELDDSKDMFSKEGGRWKKLPGPLLEAKNIHDRYDFYENVNGRTIAKLQKGDVIGIKMDLGEGKPNVYYRKVIRVTDDGRVVVAENRKQDIIYKNGGTAKAGLYAKYINMGDIAKVGYRLGKITGDAESGWISEVHQDILNRRAKLHEYAQVDLDWNDFEFRTKAQADSWNARQKPTSKRSLKYIPLTSKILSPDSGIDDTYLSRKLEVVPKEQAAYVSAWHDGDTMLNVVRGVGANTKFYKASDITTKGAKYSSLKPKFAELLMPGDWVVTQYRAKDGQLKQWASVIDRIENGNIYKINSDMTTSRVNLNNFLGVRTSARNSKFDGFKRDKNLAAAVKPQVMQSIDLAFKSPADSRRAILEIGNRMQDLNPDIKLNYAEKSDIATLLKATGHDYSNARAFVLGGEVYVNMGKASVSDVIHEYAHLFLHSLKYESPDLYNNVINSTVRHPLFDDIASNYQHLDSIQDLNEEVFVTLLGEYMKGGMSVENKQAMEENKGTWLGFADYTTKKLTQVLGGEKDSLYTKAPGDILNMRVEDVIGMVGDHVMNNRISDIYDDQVFSTGRDVEQLKQALKEKGLITEECYG